MPVLKIVLSNSNELCLLDENRYQKLREVIYYGILSKNMLIWRITRSNNFNMPVCLKSTVD